MIPRFHRFAVPALAAAVVGCQDLADTADEVLEIAASGGAEHLRDPLRPPAGPPRVLVFALDGVGHEALGSALDEGRLPSLSRLLGERRDSVTFVRGIDLGPMLTVFPSITIAAWTSAMTGLPPGETGVPGNEWFGRETRTFHAPAPVSVSGRSDAVETLSDHLLDSLVTAPTLFESADVRSYVSLMPLHRGADVLALPGAGDLAEILAAFPEGAAKGAVDRELYSTVDRASAARMVEVIEEEGLPDLAVVYFPGIDLYTHASPSPLEEQQRYLAEVTDSAIARVLAAYRAAGGLEGTWVVVTGDHGHTPVPHSHVHALGGDSAFSAGSALESAGFRLRPTVVEADADDWQAVMAWQGALAYVSLADRSTCSDAGAVCDWAEPPRWEEDVLPAARALAAAAERHPSRPLDLVILRRGSTEGSELFVLVDGDPVPLDSYLSASPRPELLRFRERLAWLTSGRWGHRAGDVILMARLGASLAPGERHYFSKPYHSWHASAEAQDSEAPLIVARADATAEDVRAVVAPWTGGPTQLDVTPLVLRLLDAGDPRARVDAASGGGAP